MILTYLESSRDGEGHLKQRAIEGQLDYDTWENLGDRKRKVFELTEGLSNNSSIVLSFFQIDLWSSINTMKGISLLTSLVVVILTSNHAFTFPGLPRAIILQTLMM